MGLTEFRVGGVVGFFLVGLVTTVGAAVVSLLVSRVVQAGLAVAAWLRGLQPSARVSGDHAATTARAPAADGTFQLGVADHALLARQAWWRLRC